MFKLRLALSRFSFALILLAGLLLSLVVQAETGMGLVVDKTAKVAHRVDLVDGAVAYTTPAIGVDVENGRFSPDGTRLAYVNSSGQVFVCDLDGEVQSSFQAWDTGSLSWTYSGIWIGGEGRAELYDPDSGDQLRSFVPDYDPPSDIKVRTISHNDEVAGALRYPSPIAKAIIINDGAQVVDLGSGCSVGPSPDGSMLTHNLWESGLEHQTMKVHARDGTLLHYLYLFDVIPYPANETDGWSWNSQLWSSNSNDIMLVPTGRGFPQMTDSRMPWIYNLESGEAFCLHTDPYAWDVFWHPSDSHTGVTGPRPGMVEIESFTAAPHTIEQGQSATLTWSVLHADAVTLDGQVVDAVATMSVSPEETTTYRLEAEGDGGPLVELLTVTVVAQPVSNEPPEVSAGNDISVTVAVPYRIDASASDDGMPDGTLELRWTLEAGPGSVTIDDDTAEDVYVTFDEVGAHTLRLTATDGEHTSFDELSVEVVAAQTPVINILSPAPGDVLYIGEVTTIVWETFNLDDVIISYSTDDRTTWTPLTSSIDASSPQWLAFSWQIPDQPSSQVWIWMEGYFGEATTYAGPFEIAARPEPEPEPEPEPVAAEPAGPQVYQLNDGLACRTGAGAPRVRGLALLLLLSLLRRRRR